MYVYVCVCMYIIHTYLYNIYTYITYIEEIYFKELAHVIVGQAGRLATQTVVGCVG